MERFRLVRLLVAAAVIGISVLPVFASPAQACSCAGVSDVETWVDESEAVFIGTLVDKRNTVDFQAIYVFEVEKWIKGDLGDVIEVRSGRGGADCGFEFPSPDQRTGAAIRAENGELHGGLCSQVDADVLLAAVDGPKMSDTGVGYLLVGGGWSSATLSVIDEQGALVTALDHPDPGVDSIGSWDVCPGKELAVEWAHDVTVWDLRTLEPVETFNLTGREETGWQPPISCRDRQGKEIWIVEWTESSPHILDVRTDQYIAELSGVDWQFGSDFVITRADIEANPVRVDLDSGREVLLHETPSLENWSVETQPHPSDGRVALLETRFPGGGEGVEATLHIIGPEGETLQQFEIPWESYRPVWLDNDRVAIQSYDWDGDQTYGIVYDVVSNETIEVAGWEADFVIADGDTLYGTSGGDVIAADLESRETRIITTLPTQSAGPLILLREAPPRATTSTSVAPMETETTTPPLVSPELGVERTKTTPAMRLVAGTAVLAFLGVLFWLVRHPGKPG